VYTSFGLKNGDSSFDFKESVVDQLGNLLDRKSFPKQPIHLVNFNTWESNKQTLLERLTKYFENPHYLPVEYLEKLMFDAFSKFGFPIRFTSSGVLESIAILCKLQDNENENKLKIRKDAFESDKIYRTTLQYLTYVVDSMTLHERSQKKLDVEDQMYINFLKKSKTLDELNLIDIPALVERSNRLVRESDSVSVTSEIVILGDY
jgi:hypothetical protein